MSQSDQFDNLNNEQEEVSASYDTYTTDSSADIYNTPNVDGASSDSMPAKEIVVADGTVESMPAEEIVDASAVVESAPVEEPSSANIVVESVSAEESPVQQNFNQGNAPYNNVPYNNPYGANPYSGQKLQNNNGPYNNDPYNNNPYNTNSYNNNPYNSNQYNNRPGNNQYVGNPYDNSPYGAQNAQNINPYGGYQYGNNQYGNNQYGNNQYGNGPAGIPPYGNNQYSPYAVPPKKNRTGLIIGVVITIILLFLIAVFALIYRAMSFYSQDRDSDRGNRDEYRFDYDDDRRADRDQKDKDRDLDDHRDWFDYDEDDYDDSYDDDYDDWDDWDDYDDDSMYYDLHDDIRTDLSYSVDIEYFEYDTDNDNVDIWVEYPVIEGDNVPNLDKLNEAFRDETDMLTELFEDEYKDYLTDDDSYFMAYSVGYVTYMDEEKMSVVFDERIYSDYYMDVYLYCINIDMENGVIMDNEHILSIDDDFSVDFRERNDIQNGEIDYLTRLTDQEITKHFNSPGVIVFYTPMGMEIGFNYDEGWVTVTYEDYKQYLNVF